MAVPLSRGPYLPCNPVNVSDNKGPWHCSEDLGPSPAHLGAQCKNFTVFPDYCWVGLFPTKKVVQSVDDCCGLATTGNYGRWSYDNSTSTCELFKEAFSARPCKGGFLGTVPFDSCNCTRVHKTGRKTCHLPPMPGALVAPSLLGSLVNSHPETVFLRPPAEQWAKRTSPWRLGHAARPAIRPEGKLPLLAKSLTATRHFYAEEAIGCQHAPMDLFDLRRSPCGLWRREWYSHPAAGECKNGHYVGDGSGCTWRLVEQMTSINASCLYNVVDDNIENADESCFSACAQPKNRTSTCYLQCYSQAVRTMTHEQLTMPWVKAFASDDPTQGGCPRNTN